MRTASAALRVRDFRLFWTGALISNSGNWMQNVAVPFVVFQLTGSAAWVGFAGFAQFLPAWLMGPLGGAVADRFPRRRVLIVTAAAQAMAATAMAVAWASGVRSPWAYVGLVAVSGSIGGINIGSWQAFVPELVPREHLLNAVTLNSAQFNAARAFGPAVGGLVLAQLGVTWAFGLNALSFAAVIGALLLVKAEGAVARGGGRPKVLAETWDAIRYVRDRPGIVTAIFVVVALGFLGSPIFSFIVVFAEDVFGVGDTAYGVLAAAQGAGAVLGAPIIAGPGTAWARSRLTKVGMVAYGSALVAFALSPLYLTAVLALLVSGAAYLAIAASLNTSIQLQVEDHMRGRVMALYVMGITATVPLGNLVQGALVEVVGARATTTGAGLAFIGVFLVLRASRRLRTLDAEADGEGGLAEGHGHGHVVGLDGEDGGPGPPPGLVDPADPGSVERLGD